MRTAWVLVVALVMTARHALRVLWASWRKSPNLEEVCDDAPRAWATSLLRAAGVTVEWAGLDRLAAHGPGILIVNHESWFDVLVLAAHLPVTYRFVGKKELVSVPLFGPAWLACGHIAIDRSDRESAIRSLEHAGELLRRHGGVIIMFPEGTRSTDGDLLPFKKGAFVLALKLGVPIIPVGIAGSRQVMRKHGFRVRSGTIRVQVGEPIPVAGLDENDRDRLMERTRTVVDRLRKGDLR